MDGDWAFRWREWYRAIRRDNPTASHDDLYARFGGRFDLVRRLEKDVFLARDRLRTSESALLPWAAMPLKGASEQDCRKLLDSYDERLKNEGLLLEFEATDHLMRKIWDAADEVRPILRKLQR